ncbi:L-histidine N(alpha)-methyltransferase [Rhodospirillales bacterium]|jgi:dimethylhistidine N-methyltransferase|nr:L-histidine N(alpha)-methyltransferase [Rhodospirillales bacterium]
MPLNPPNSSNATFLDDVLHGLGSQPKQMPPKYFYDAIGAELFTQICELEEYYPTRTEISILQKNATDIATKLGEQAMLIEYGSGSLDKVRILLDALSDPVALCAIDISAEQLKAASKEVQNAYPELEVLAVEADFTQVVPLPSPETSPKAHVAFFPGSTIGNFAPENARDFLAGISETIGVDGLLLIGVDLKKDASRLVAAYDDAKGVTAAFNLNLLQRINFELGGDFDLTLFRHIARYSKVNGRIEMHLESCTDQTVRIGDHAFDFEAGETIHTENSYKFSSDEFQALAQSAGFDHVQSWSDPEDLFSVMLFHVSSR